MYIYCAYTATSCMQTIVIFTHKKTNIYVAFPIECLQCGACSTSVYGAKTLGTRRLYMSSRRIKQRFVSIPLYRQ